MTDLVKITQIFPHNHRDFGQIRDLISQIFYGAQDIKQSMDFYPKYRDMSPHGKRNVSSTRGSSVCMWVCVAACSGTVSLSRDVAVVNVEFSMLITYPYTRIPTVCLSTDSSNE